MLFNKKSIALAISLALSTIGGHAAAQGTSATTAADPLMTVVVVGSRPADTEPGSVVLDAASEVRAQLPSTTNIFGSDNDDINSALIDATRLQAIAEANDNGKQRNLTGNLYSSQAPTGGKEASKLWVFYSFLNQALWTYDPASQAYLRQQDQADGSGESIPAATGSPASSSPLKT